MPKQERLNQTGESACSANIWTLSLPISFLVSPGKKSVTLPDIGTYRAENGLNFEVVHMLGGNVSSTQQFRRYTLDAVRVTEARIPHLLHDPQLTGLLIT